MSEVHDIVWSISVDANLRTAWHQSVRYEKATFPRTITFHFATSICGLFVLVAETSVTWLCFTTGRRLTPFYQGDQLIVRKTSIAPPTQEYHFPIGSFTGSIAEQSKLTAYFMLLSIWYIVIEYLLKLLWYRKVTVNKPNAIICYSTHFRISPGLQNVFRQWYWTFHCVTRFSLKARLIYCARKHCIICATRERNVFSHCGQRCCCRCIKSEKWQEA